MTKPFAEARERQIARLDGAKPPTARGALALAKSQAYQDAADAPSTRRAYASDLANYGAKGLEAMPSAPEVVGAALSRTCPAHSRRRHSIPRGGYPGRARVLD